MILKILSVIGQNGLFKRHINTIEKFLKDVPLCYLKKQNQVRLDYVYRFYK